MRTLAIGSLMLIVAACASPTGSSSTPAQEHALAQNEDGAWHWAELTPSPTLSLAGERASGFAGCNRWFGTAKRGADGALTINAVGTTRMACPEPRMEIERDFIDRLGRIRSARVASDGALIAKDDKNVVIFTLQSGDPSK